MNNNRNMTDAELDALFKNADNATPVPAFDDAFWGEMEAMLPEKKRVGAFFWWFSGAALVAGIAVLMVIYTADQTESSSPNAIAKATKSTPSNNEKNTAHLQETTNENTVKGNGEHPSRTDQGQPHAIAPRVKNTKPVKPYAQNTTGHVNVEENKNMPLDQELANMGDVTNELPSEKEWNHLGKRMGLFTAPVVLNDVATHRSVSSSVPFYTEFAVGFGQSYKRIASTNNWATQFRLGVGLTKEVPGMQLSAGLAFRAEMPNNLSSLKTESNGSQTKTTVSNYRGLYSVEFPLEAAGKFGRNALGLFMVPGIQLGYTGNKNHYQNNVLLARERTSGTLTDAKTMTMECGLKYAFDVTECLQFTGSCTFDMVRPFQSVYYQGENQEYPVTFFVGVRRKF